MIADFLPEVNRDCVHYFELCNNRVLLSSPHVNFVQNVTSLLFPFINYTIVDVEASSFYNTCDLQHLHADHIWQGEPISATTLDLPRPIFVLMIVPIITCFAMFNVQLMHIA